MEDDKQYKQKYLRQHIIDKNFNPQDFVIFLNSRLPIGDDLNLCSIEQLKDVVTQFVQQKNNQKIQQKFIKTKDLEEFTTESPPIIRKPRAIIFKQYTPNLIQLQYSKSYKCQKTINKYSDVKEMKCQVNDPVRKNVGGIFGIGSTSFLEFAVRTSGLGWNVGRRYSDFIWLRSYLLKSYPTHIIPPIPTKKASKKTQKDVVKRMRILQYFLNDLINVPQLLNNRFVEGFLKIDDPNKFQSLKKQSQKQMDFTSMSQYSTKEGIVESKLSQENKAFFQEMQKFIPFAETTYKQITRCGKQLQDFVTQEVNTLYQIGNHFADLHERAREILNRIPKTQGLSKLNQIYITLNNMMVQWGNILRNQNQMIEKNLNTFFKYVRNDLHGYNEAFLNEKIVEEEFVKCKFNLEKKKEKIYNLFDANKWQLNSKDDKPTKEIIHDRTLAFPLMLPKQTNQLQSLRSRLFFYINNLHINGCNNLTRAANRFQENFKEFVIMNKVNNQHMCQMWSEMSSSFSNSNNKFRMLKETPIINDIANQIIDD